MTNRKMTQEQLKKIMISAYQIAEKREEIQTAELIKEIKKQIINEAR
ncbi:hypothetical protein [Bacillus sp. FJAT-42376]|nr:hypothetical protein [Bacillus sp. FJAT-42376]